MRPLFQGALTPQGETLVCTSAPPVDAIPVAALLHGSTLLDACLRPHAQHLGVSGTDLRATASSWSLAYLDALLPTVVATASVLQHVFPVRPESTSVQLGEGAAPRAFHIRHDSEARPGTGTPARFGTLIDAHLAPLFAALTRQARVAPKILWGNMARLLDFLFDQALRQTRDAPHIACDRDHLLYAPSWQDGQANPMCHPQRTVRRIHPDMPGAITLHRQCCLCYRLPGQDYCGACPLAPQFRLPRRCLTATTASS